ncbi:DUF3368 domain-containing protein [Larkinella sp.]|uniref:DUF3368 domain-containing protein n=1 Tax=Larkinella sp. TaxID=2034517 RepID=UPI003BA8CA0C
MIVVSDASPIVAFFELQLLELLPTLFKEVTVPEAVYQELLTLAPYYETLAPITEATWLRIIPVIDKNQVERLCESIDAGEAEAIILYRQVNADLLLIDERAGRLVAKEMEIEAIGTLGILRQAKLKGLISELKPAIEHLRGRLKFRLSDSLIQQVLKSVGE